MKQNEKSNIAKQIASKPMRLSSCEIIIERMKNQGMIQPRKEKKKG